MRIIDAHAHVIERVAGFGPRGELRPIGGGKARWADGSEISMIPEEMGSCDFTGEALLALMDSFQVEKAVLLQGSFYGFQNEYTFETVEKYPERFIGAGTFDPFCAERDRLLERLLCSFGFRIIKFEVSSGGGLMGYHEPFSVDGPVFAPVISRIADSGATLVLDIGSPGMKSYQPEAVKNIANRYPAMKIVLCHLLGPGVHDLEALTEGLKTLKRDNIWFDLAAVPWNLEPEPYETARKFVKTAKGLVGAEKLIWGTDVPSVLTKERYADLIGYLADSHFFSQTELEAVFYHNACAAYPINVGN
ncbi:MAG: hydrolase [Bacillota bacterium]|jgi:predicted TIM-barrel fold metal-dependent hydrolase|nr:hydrolase [Bacillota bacterium]